MITNNRYIHGITIGPIVAILSKARKTRELWAASFITSLLSKKILEQLQVSKIQDLEIILPNPEILSILDHETNKGIGIAPDRIVFLSHHREETKLTEAISNAKQALATELSGFQNGTTVEQFLLEINANFRIETYIQTLDSSTDKSLLAQINPFLDQLELMAHYQPELQDSALKSFFEAVNKGKDESFLVKYFKNETLQNSDFNGNYRIPSVMEIATIGLQSNPEYVRIANRTIWDISKSVDIDDGEDQFYKDLKDSYNRQKIELKNRTSFKNYHKYYALILADGDKVGKLLSSYSAANKDAVGAISKSLIAYATSALKVSYDYGALPIYIGGDDYLALAPVVGKDGKHLIDFTEDIRRIFKEQFASYPFSDEKDAPDLSFAIRVQYYKAPLFETIDSMYEDLYRAKQYGKGSLSFRLLYHSGSKIEQIFGFGSERYTWWKKLLSLQKDMEPLKGFTYFLREAQPIFSHTDAQGIQCLYDHRMDISKDKENSENPKQEGYHDYIKKMLCDDILQDVRTGAMQTYQALRLSYFLNGLDNE